MARASGQIAQPIVWDRARRTLDAGPRELTARSDDRPGALVVHSSGFIANRADLLGGLPLAGDCSDADLVVELYRRHGLETPKLIFGPFCWLLWDREARRLVAVRDRLGIEGLYYSQAGQRVHFAGRPAPLLGEGLARGDADGLDDGALAEYLCGGVPSGGRTVYRSLHQVEAGSVRVEEDSARTQPYWSIEPKPVWKARSDAEYAEGLWELLSVVVRQHLSASPVGITLSGGLDSTSVAAAAREWISGSELRPFCWASPELPEADEWTLASSVCSRLELEPERIRADRLWPLSDPAEPQGTAAGPARVFFPELWHATLRRASAAGVSSLLTGASGDHLFGGNVFAYPDLLLTLRWGRLTRELRRHLASTESSAWSVARRMILGPIARWLLGRQPAPRAPDWLGERARAELPRRSRPSRPRILPGRAMLVGQLRERYLLAILDEIREWSLDHQVELRHPLLDHRLFELAASLPATQVFRAAERKPILRHAVGSRLPEPVVSQRGKIVPVTIFHHGVRDRGRKRVLSLLEDMRAADLGLVEPARLRSAYERYAADSDAAMGFWRGIALEAWLRRLDG